MVLLDRVEPVIFTSPMCSVFFGRPFISSAFTVSSGSMVKRFCLRRYLFALHTLGTSLGSVWNGFVRIISLNGENLPDYICVPFLIVSLIPPVSLAEMSKVKNVTGRLLATNGVLYYSLNSRFQTVLEWFLTNIYVRLTALRHFILNIS